MTIYILAGGNDRSYDDFGTKLVDTIHQHVHNPKILSCQFSRDKDIWDARFKDWEVWFKKYFGNETEVQLAQPETFLDQVNWADVIYLHGGYTEKLLEALAPYEDLAKHFAGKIIVGSSAGTNYLSKTYFSPKRNLVGQGSGILDVNTIVHYKAASDGEINVSPSGWDEVVERMKAAVGDEKITLLPEGEFVVIEK